MDREKHQAQGNLQPEARLNPLAGRSQVHTMNSNRATDTGSTAGTDTAAYAAALEEMYSAAPGVRKAFALLGIGVSADTTIADIWLERAAELGITE